MHLVRAGRQLARLLIVGLVLFNAASIAAFQTVAAGSIRGTVATQNSTIPLGGVLVSLVGDHGEVSSTLSEGDGTFAFTSVVPGTYSLVAALEGFDALKQPVTVDPGGTASVKLDLRIGSVSERVEVIAPSTVIPSTGTLTSSEEVTSRELDQIAGGGGLQSALRMLVSVIQVPGGISIKGGRPNQAAVQLGPGRVRRSSDRAVAGRAARRCD